MRRSTTTAIPVKPLSSAKTLSDQIGILPELVQIFHSDLANNTLTIPPEKGLGVITKMNVAPGLQVTCWDIEKLNFGILFQRLPDTSLDSKVFCLFSILTDDSFLIREYADKSGDQPKTPNNVVFACNNIDLHFSLTGGRPIRVIQIDITEQWLINEFGTEGALYKDLLQSTEPVFSTRRTFFRLYHDFFSLYKHLSGELPNAYYTRAKALSIFSDLFTTSDKEVPANDNHVQMHETMITVENILDDHLETNLPALSVIARKIGMSESTMKRNFKLVYGTSIYELYLRKKMNKARELIIGNGMRVNEAAIKLGYEKTSNFIQMFKKHHNASPGSLKKKLTANSIAANYVEEVFA